jgi:citrate lyase subunit beta-like protein
LYDQIFKTISILQEEARDTVCRLLGELQFGRSEVCVRINSITSGLAGDDLNAVLTAKVLPHTVVVPKVDSLEDIRWVRVITFKLLTSVNHL